MLTARIFRAMLWCFPAPFRDEYGTEMVGAFMQDLREARRLSGRWAEALIWLRSISDIITTAPEEHYHVIQQDARYALRTLCAQPGFTAIAVLSLALGIGANLAIYSLVESVMMRLLPVRNPQELVMLTNPAASGLSVGANIGERDLMTYPEFLQLRDQSTVFSSLMAAQSMPDRLTVRIGNGEPENVRTRMVSAEYFDTLGVPAMMGRTLTAVDGPAPPVAVISHSFWQRRLGGRANPIGLTITLRHSAFTVIGVMPSSFFGETVGERPDIWLPMTMQPVILPGRELLHDDLVGLQKSMWLHVFGRLKPGVSAAQAQAAANVTFQQGLSSYYSSSPTEEVRRRFLNQRLRVRPAWTGASTIREEFSQPLSMLLAAAGLVLLIACANLGNLMLGRATARTREMAVRLALGARRGNLVRQWLTESMMIALAGGVVGLAAAWVLRRGLLMLVSDSIRLPENPSGNTWAFALGLTIVTGLLLGLLPALRTWNVEANAGLKEQGRGLTAAAGWLRAGKVIVAGQVALSLPLLMGAGLLVRTLQNLQRVDLGFNKENLLVVSVDVITAGYEEPKRQALFERLYERVRATPGIRAATYSRHGLFAGDAGDEVLVEGYTRKGDDDRGSRYEHVGPNYFSTLGVPLLLGREINERDHAGGPKVCVVNEAFVKKFFAGRNPIGMHVTQLYGPQRNTFEVVGVAADFRKGGGLRRQIDPRYFVPVAQPIDVPRAIAFLVRTVGDPGSLAPSMRRSILTEDPDLPIMDARPLPELVAERMMQDRMLARLSLAFGAVALVLSAIGLYGVLSYAVTRRTSEIGIRKALGAGEGTVISMILRESSWLLAGGLAAGAGLAFALLRLIENRLFGLSGSDPATFAAAALLLSLVALAAAWLPARRASRVDPLVAIRYE